MSQQKGTHKDWKRISEHLATEWQGHSPAHRTEVQCQHRWTKVLNPELVKGPWTEEARIHTVAAHCHCGATLGHTRPTAGVCRAHVHLRLHLRPAHTRSARCQHGVSPDPRAVSTRSAHGQHTVGTRSACSPDPHTVSDAIRLYNTGGRDGSAPGPQVRPEAVACHRGAPQGQDRQAVP